MPSVGHLAVGLASSRLPGAPAVPRALWGASLALLALLPDADVLAFSLGIPYAAPFGHRGALHSLPVAAFGGLLAGVVAWSLRARAVPVALVTGLVLGSHGLLDTLTDGGLGIALFWPFSETRYFAPWRPIPVAPLGLRLLTPRGLALMLYEGVLFLPLFVVGLWPRSRTGGPAA